MTTGMALTITGLRVTYQGPPPVRAVDQVDLRLPSGECLGILGESGSGKSTLARAILGLTDQTEVTGSIRLGSQELTDLDENGWRRVRWCRVALVFQSTSALNPVLRVDAQVAEPLIVHEGIDQDDARGRAVEMLEQVGLRRELADRYPHELSGGQRRLALLAMALICEPDVLVLDEPTAGLDPLTRGHVLQLLRDLRERRAQSLLVLTHDVDALARLADRTTVMYRGAVAEVGPTSRVLADPRHPYAFGLLNSRPTLGTLKDLRGIRGDPPDPTTVAAGCPFAERCTQVIDECLEGRPAMEVPRGEDGSRVVACIRGGLVPVVSARGLRKTYSINGGRKREEIAAVDGIDLEVREGEVVGLVGPNGAGKSTLGQLLLRLIEADGGTVELEGQDLLGAKGDALKHARRRAQMLFQDPYEALSPRLTVNQAVREPLDIQEIGTPAERDRLVADTMRAVRLSPDNGFLARHTHELSGGQLQRVALARALVVEPKLLVADEPLEGLDPSEQAKMLQLLKAIQVERGMAMILVSHDLAVVLRTVDRVLVLDHGRVVEEQTGTSLLRDPRHPTTRKLLEASGRSLLVTSGLTDPSSQGGHHAGI
jgi:peptide/nickel transport system ATP-binding protein